MFELRHIVFDFKTFNILSLKNQYARYVTDKITTLTVNATNTKNIYTQDYNTIVIVYIKKSKHDGHDVTMQHMQETKKFTENT